MFTYDAYPARLLHYRRTYVMLGTPTDNSLRTIPTPKGQKHVHNAHILLPL